MQRPARTPERTHVPAHAAWSFVLLSLASASASALPGRLEPALAHSVASARVFARATTYEPAGLRVLWHGPTHGYDFDPEGWLATEPRQLSALWSSVGRPELQPEVDFTRYVVF